MNGQQKSYDRYLESLKNTPGPVNPPTDRTIDLRGLYDYLQKTGKNASELTNDEYKPFIIYLNEEKIV
jgi:hypothetical protein